MFNLGDVLKFVIDGLDDGPFTEKYLVADQFSKQQFNECLVLERFTVINIAGSYHKAQQFSHLIAYQMKFEAIELCILIRWFLHTRSNVLSTNWKYISQMFLNFIDIEMLETLVSAQVEQNHYGYDLRRGHSRVAMILAFGLVALRCKTVCLDESVIKFAKVIGHTENFVNFVS